MSSTRFQPTRREFLRSALALSGVVAARHLLSSDAASAASADGSARRLSELDAPRLEADVCIIGSGPAGAVLATALASRGIATLLTESGPDRASPSRAAGVGKLDAYASTGDLPYPVGQTRFRGAGGTSNLWTGNCPRFHPFDFEPNAYTPPNAPWPLRYADLETYYMRAEEELRVRGAAAMPFAPPRSGRCPRALTIPTPNLQRLVERSGAPIVLEQLPWSDWYGQPMRMAMSHLPGFSASPDGTLVCGSTATRILCDETGRITGIRLEAVGEPPRTARAQVYVIACGGIETARLLLLSRCARFPDGIGNHSDLVGRCFMEHPAVAIGMGTVRGLWNPWPLPEKAFSERFVADAKRQGFGGVRLRLLATRPPLELELSHPLETLRRSARAVRDLDVDVKAQIEMEPSPANRVTLTDSRRDAFGNPGASLSLGFTANDQRTMRYSEEVIRRTLAALGAKHVALEPCVLRWDHHHMGTCRMGDNPNTSVVDRDLRVHGAANLYLAGSAPFVTSGVSNPTLTIVALALRLADHLTERLRPDYGVRVMGLRANPP